MKDFIEVESVNRLSTDRTRAMIKIENIDRVVDMGDYTDIFATEHGEDKIFRIAEKYKDVRENIMSDGMRKAYSEGKTDAVNETIEIFRKKADCISREDIENYVSKRLDGYLTEDERREVENLAEFVAELPKFDILDIFTT